MSKIKINDADDLNLIISDMFDDFLSDFHVRKGLTFEEEEGVFAYTNKGEYLIARFKNRMLKVFVKYFDEEDFNINSTNYRDYR